MLQGIFDTHAHYTDAAFQPDRDCVLAALPEKGVCGAINCGTDALSSRECMQLAEKYGYLYFAAGIHPEDCGGKPLSDLNEIETMLRHKKCVAVGEIGLDRHYPEPPEEVQALFFERQLQMACAHGKPVIVHDREAHGLTMELLRKYRPQGVLHCFSGSVEMMREALALGFYIGLGGAVTFKNAKRAAAVAKEVPAERLLLETDCPYMAPVPFRGERNDSSLIAYTADFIAGLRGVDAQELVNRCTKNAERLFFGA